MPDPAVLTSLEYDESLAAAAATDPDVLEVVSPTRVTDVSQVRW